MSQHKITTGNAPVERGGWPYATCTCGWFTTSKDADIVDSDVEKHTEEVGA